MERLIQETPRAIAKMQGQAVADAFLDVVAHSPVRFGYYRASHVVGEGDGEQPSEILFEHPDRPPAQGPHPARPVIPPPDVGSARAILARGSTTWVRGAVWSFRRLLVWNGVKHAGYVEWGTAAMAPRLVYERARAALAANVAARVRQLELELVARFR